jgi:hypothetical protein
MITELDATCITDISRVRTSMAQGSLDSDELFRVDPNETGGLGHDR